jgi:hypothetical protein
MDEKITEYAGKNDPHYIKGDSTKLGQHRLENYGSLGLSVAIGRSGHI